MMSRGDSEIPRPEPERKKTSKYRFADTLRKQFREVMNAITGWPKAAPRKRSRKRETIDAIKACASALLDRLAQSTVLGTVYPPWDTFTWLQIWDYDEFSGANSCESASHTEQEYGLSPRL
jgi:hypothetical protein